MSRASAAMISVALCVLAFGCDGGGASPRPTPPSATAPTPTATPPRPGETGIADVDRVVAALLSGDAERVRSAVGYVRVPCEVEPEGLGAPPACRSSEAEGTPVDVFQGAQCEGFYVRPEEMQSVVDGIVSAPLELYAVFESGDRWPEGEYVAVFATDVVDRPERDARAAVIAHGWMVGFHFGCAMTPEEYLDFYGVTPEELILHQPKP